MPSSQMKEWDEFYKQGKTAIIPDLFTVRRFSVERSAGRSVLVLAAGAGRNAIWLAKRGFTVMATDLSEEATEKAKWWARVEGVDDHFDAVQLDLLDAQTRSFGFLGRNYDFLIFEGCLEYFDDVQALEVIKRTEACTKRTTRVFVHARGPSHWAHSSRVRSDGFMATNVRGQLAYIKLMDEALQLNHFSILKEESRTELYEGSQMKDQGRLSQDLYIEGWI